MDERKQGKDKDGQITLNNTQTSVDNETNGNAYSKPNETDITERNEANHYLCMYSKDNFPIGGTENSQESSKNRPHNAPIFEIPLSEIIDRNSNPIHTLQMKNGNSFDDLNEDTTCGIGWFRPEWLQKWATAKVYLVLYSIIGTLSGAYYTYRIGTITTLEKRFAFQSKTSGAIMMLDELTPVFFGALVGYFGGRAHRPRMFGLGMMFVVVACLVSVLPYFMYGSEKHINLLSGHKNESEIRMCEKDEVYQEECDVDSRPPSMTAILIFMLASFLKGFGNLAYLSIGLSYMDDAAKKKNTPIYLATAFTSRLLGPLLGFLMSSAFLKYYENPFEDPGYGPEDPRWIGAWWIGYCFNAVLLFICSIPLVIFPRRLPGHPKIQETTNEIGSENGLISSFAGLFEAIKRLMKNRLYAAILFRVILSIFAGTGYFIMLPKYMEHQFRLSSSDASLFSGPLAVVAIMASTVAGSSFVWKYKPKPKHLILGMIALDLVGVLGYSIMMIPGCETIEMTHYGTNQEGLNLDDVCNSNCNCTTSAFTPVCGPDGQTVYFSPCYAGCVEKMNETYTDCSCIPDSTGHDNVTATSGFCPSDTCWTQALIYLTILPIMEFFLQLLRIPEYMMLLRCIAPKDKSVALGTFEAVICILGIVPFVVVFGAVIDTTCLVREKSCGEIGNCWFYDIPSFKYVLHGSSLFFSILAAFSLIPVYCLSDRLVDFYEDKDVTNVEGVAKADIKKEQAGNVTEFCEK